MEKVFIKPLIKKGHLLLITLCVVLTFSCSDESELYPEQETSIQSEYVNQKTSRSSMSIDNISLHDMQSDQMAMLIDCITPTDTLFTLGLSRDEAQLLGIPDSLYERAIAIVDSLNVKYHN